MRKRIWKGIVLMICITALFSTYGVSAYAAKGDKDNNTTKRVLVKYKKDNSMREDTFKQKNNKQKVRKYKKLNERNLYSIEVDSSGYGSLLQDSEIEFVEEDALVQLLSEPQEDNQSSEDIVLSQKKCILCGELVCSNQEECIDTTHEICNSCIFELFSDSLTGQDIEDGSVIVSPSEDNCECGCTEENHDQCLTGDCVPECTCNTDESGITSEISDGATETSNGSIITEQGDEQTWNFLRTKANYLHDNNILGDGIRVAVFDTGIDPGNEDLNVAGGISFVEGVSSYNDDNGHGTAMASILAAQYNCKGYVGISPNIELYSVKVLDQDGAGRYSNIIQGIDWAIQNDIDIITLSLGGYEYSQILEEAINHAIENNILIVAAAGNGGAENIMYPAAYSQVICVGATDRDNNIASYSNYGFQLDIVAPGTEVVTAGLNNSSITVSGTSPATQHVAGVAALLWSADRTLTNGHIKYLLYKNAFNLGEYNTCGHGLLDAVTSYFNLLNGNFPIYVEEGGNGNFINGLVDVGWDCVVYGQACSSHTMKEVNTPPTCTKDGLLTQICTKCGASSSVTVAKLGHNYKTTTKAATCTSDGSKITKCERCGNVSSSETINKLGHQTSSTTVPPTCTKDGKTTITCSRCTYKKETILDRVGHIEGPSKIGKDSNCKEEGYTVVNCSRSGCGLELRRDPIPKKPHNYINAGTPISATCKLQGYTPYSCSCGAVQKGDYTGPLDHNWSLVLTDPSTCTSEGANVYACINCGTGRVDPISKTGHDYSGHYESPTHSTNGHYWENYCRNCGSVSSSGYTTNSNCLSCTTPPSVSFVNLSGSTVLSETDLSFLPQIRVYDNENDTLTCRYYLDGSTSAIGTITVSGTKPEKTVAFTTPFSAANLTEGNHTIRATVKDSVAPLGEVTVTFKVDKSAPVINTHTITPSSKDVRFMVTATDAFSGLDATAYRYTVSGTATGWIASNNYTVSGLIPDTSYSYIVEVRDVRGHIASQTGNFSTKVETPAVTVTALHEDGLQIVVKDDNTSSTQYRVKIGEGYVDASGKITGIECWIMIPYDVEVNGKKIVLYGLEPNTLYSVTVSARNSLATEIVNSIIVSATTSPAAPVNISVTSKSHNHVSLTWDSVAGAVNYEIYRETIDELGNVTTAHSKVIATNYCYDGDVLPEQNYQYQIRSINQAGIYGKWSTPKLQAYTIPAPPDKVTGVTGTPQGTQIELTWNTISDAVGYLVEISYDGNTKQIYSATNGITFDTEVFNCQCDIKVKAFNIYNEAEPENTTYWENEGEFSDAIIQYTMADSPAINPISEEQITPNSITVSWDIKQNPESVIYRLCITQSDASVREIDIAGLVAIDNIITYQVTGLLPETIYSFRVKALNSINVETEWSDVMTAATLMDYPHVPGGLRATAKADRISLIWDEAEHAQSYQIEKNGTILIVDWPGTNYVDTDVQPDSEYLYRVKAVNTTGESDWSQNLVKKTLGNVPVPPTITLVSGSSISVTIEWTSAVEVSGYEIEADGQIYNIGTGTTFEHNGLAPGTTHVYAVRSRNVYGKSEWSSFATYRAKPLIPDIPVITQVLPSESQISLLWDPVEGASYYEVEIDGIIVGVTQALGYQYTFQEEAAAGSEHTVRVRAINESGEGGWTAPMPVLIPDDGAGSAPIIPIPSAPYPVCIATGSAIITIEWDAVPDATYYQLEADSTIIYTGSDSSYVHTGLMPGSSHQYRVLAGNLSGQSEWSEPILAATGLQYTTTPQNISFYRVDDGTTMLLWDQATGITNYRIEINGMLSPTVVTGTSISISTTPGELYNIRVGSVVEEDGIQSIDWSEEVTFRTARKLPGIPENIVIDAGPDSITISWTAVPGAIGYEIMGARQVFVSGNNTSYVLTGLIPSSSYIINVRAYNETGAGEWSEDKSVMTSEVLPGIPVNIFGEPYQPVYSTNGAVIRLRWDPVRRATSYDVEIRNSGLINYTTTNEFIAEGLEAGNTYQIRVRANSRTSTGAWSSWISITPIVVKPNNVTTDMLEGTVKISWNPVSINDSYEIEIDGVNVQTTEGVSYEFDYSLFYMERKIRIRAIRNNMAGQWSEPIEFSQPMPVSTTVYKGETFAVLLPATNVELGTYKLTLTYNTDELELIDACEMTSEMELNSTYLEDIGAHVMIDNQGTTTSISIVVEEESGISFTGLVNSIRFRSKVTGETTLLYGVTLR